MTKRPMKLFERLLDTDVKADLLTLFHNNSNLSDTPEGLARRLNRNPGEVQKELEDLVGLGILEKVEVYSFGGDRDKEIQDAISKQLAISESAAASTGVSPLGPQIPKVKAGQDIVDELAPEGLPVPSTILILGEPGAGGENLLALLVANHLETRKSVIYITLDNFPANIRQSVQTHLADMEVDWGNLRFVDCYSQTVGVESEEQHSVDPENLSEISIAISDIMTERTSFLIVLDSLNTLIRKRGGHSALEFLRVVVARTRQAKCLALVTMNWKAWHAAHVAAAEDLVDGVIQLKVEEKPEGFERSLRIFKLVGAKHSTSWARYNLSEEGELERPE